MRLESEGRFQSEFDVGECDMTWQGEEPGGL